MTPLVDLPSASSTFAAIGAYAGPMFTELLPIVFVLTGFAVGGIIAGVIVFDIPSTIFNALHRNPK